MIFLMVEIVVNMIDSNDIVNGWVVILVVVVVGVMSRFSISRVLISCIVIVVVRLSSSMKIIDRNCIGILCVLVVLGFIEVKNNGF